MFSAAVLRPLLMFFPSQTRRSSEYYILLFTSAYPLYLRLTSAYAAPIHLVGDVMSIMELGALGEFFAAIAVLVTLVYLATGARQ